MQTIWAKHQQTSQQIVQKGIQTGLSHILFAERRSPSIVADFGHAVPAATSLRSHLRPRVNARASPLSESIHLASISCSPRVRVFPARTCFFFMPPQAKLFHRVGGLAFTCASTEEVVAFVVFFLYHTCMAFLCTPSWLALS